MCLLEYIYWLQFRNRVTFVALCMLPHNKMYQLLCHPLHSSYFGLSYIYIYIYFVQSTMIMVHYVKSAGLEKTKKHFFIKYMPCIYLAGFITLLIMRIHTYEADLINHNRGYDLSRIVHLLWSAVITSLAAISSRIWRALPSKSVNSLTSPVREVVWKLFDLLTLEEITILARYRMFQQYPWVRVHQRIGNAYIFRRSKSVAKFLHTPGMLVFVGKRIYNMEQVSGMGSVWDLGVLLWQPYSTQHWVDTYVYYLYPMSETHARKNNMFAKDRLQPAYFIEFHIMSINLRYEDVRFEGYICGITLSCVKIFLICLALSIQTKAVSCKVTFTLGHLKLLPAFIHLVLPAWDKLVYTIFTHTHTHIYIYIYIYIYI